LLALDMHLKTRADYADLIVASYNRTVVYDKILKAEQIEGSEEEADDRALYRYFTRGHACPFLEPDGNCGVYAWRPMACRMFFAESSPRFCSGKYLASPWNRNFQVELPDAAEEALARCSRLLEGLELPEELFPGIVAVNAEFGRYDAK
jgi:Fe-S-cluster containining protein